MYQTQMYQNDLLFFLFDFILWTHYQRRIILPSYPKLLPRESPVLAKTRWI